MQAAKLPLLCDIVHIDLEGEQDGASLANDVQGMPCCVVLCAAYASVPTPSCMPALGKVVAPKHTVVTSRPACSETAKTGAILWGDVDVTCHVLAGGVGRCDATYRHL